MRRLIVILVAMLFAASYLFAAGGQESAAAESKPVTIEVMTNYNPNIETFAQGQDPNNNEIIEWLRENSGFDIQVELLPKDGADQKIAIVLASGDVPDIINMPGKNMYGQFAAQGALYAIDDLLDEAPVYKAVVPEDTWKSVMVNGKIYALPAPQTYHGVFGIFTRIDYLDQLGIEKPTVNDPWTVEEYYDVLAQLSEMDGVVGLTGSGWLFRGFAGAFGVSPNWRDVDGKLVPGVVQPLAKQYLQFLRRLYEEGILDREFAVNKNQNIKEKLVSGQAAMGVLAWWDAKVAYEALEANNVAAELEYIAPPVGPTGLWGMAKRGPTTFLRAIPRDAKHPLEAMQLMDFLATEAAQDLVGFGFEGVHYTREGEDIIATPKAEEIRWRIIYQWIDTPYSFNHRVRMKGYNPWFIPTETWTVLDDWSLFAPSMDVFDKNAAPLGDFVEENYIKFIMGERPLSEFDEFADEYMARGGQESMDAINEWYADFR